MSKTAPYLNHSQLAELLSQKELIIWDWNGTLLNDTELCAGIINRLLAERDLPTQEIEEHRKKFDFPIIRFYERIGFDFSEEPFEEISSSFIASYYEHLPSCELHPSARPVLELLQRQGLQQLILSASEHTHLIKTVHHYDLEAFFSELLGINSIHAEGKIDIAQNWMNAAKIDPSSVLLIGDTAHDHEVAEAMGVDCLLVAAGHHHPERLIHLGRPIIQSLAFLQENLHKGF